MAIEIDGGTDTITIGSAGVSTTYFEQADEPLAAKAGDTWRDTDTDILAYLRVDGTSRVWMEI